MIALEDDTVLLFSGYLASYFLHKIGSFVGFTCNLFLDPNRNSLGGGAEKPSLKARKSYIGMHGVSCQACRGGGGGEG